MKPDLPLREIRGIGPARARVLAEAGMVTVLDLLRHVPLRWEDRRLVIPVAAAQAGQAATFRGRLAEVRRIRTRRRGFSLVRAILKDDSGALPIVWFNQPYLFQQLRDGEEYLLHGAVREAQPAGLELINPSCEPTCEAVDRALHSARIAPVYPSIGSGKGKSSLGPAALRRMIDTVLEDFDPQSVPETLPEEVLIRRGLPRLGEALLALHRPERAPEAAGLPPHPLTPSPIPSLPPGEGETSKNNGEGDVSVAVSSSLPLSRSGGRGWERGPGGEGLALLAILLLALFVPPARAARPEDDPRSFEVLRYECASDLGRREVTLFLNGTIRLRDGAPGKELMGLGELNPDDLQGAVNRLAGEDLTEAQRLPSGVDGQWVEKCMLALHLPEKAIQVFHFGRYDTLPLNLSRIVRVAEDMAAKVPDLKGDEQLPVDYKPRVGDILKRVDGNLFRVHNISDDKQGLEMQGTVQPLTVYIRVDQLRLEFITLVSRDSVEGRVP
jgi:hypothetical protein